MNLPVLGKKSLVLLLVLVMFVAALFSLFFVTQRKNINLPFGILKQWNLTSRSMSSEKIDLIDEHPNLTFALNPLFQPDAFFDPISESANIKMPTKIIVSLSDKPQSVNNFWKDENGQNIPFSGRSHSLSSDNVFSVTLYINSDLVRKYNWTENKISSELQLLLIETLVILNGSKAQTQEVQATAKAINIQLKNNLSNAPFIISYD